MKKMLFVMLCALAAMSAQALTQHKDFDTAVSAATGDEVVMLSFTGTDWCPACIYLHDKIFAHDSFATGDFGKGLHLVEIVFPRLPEAVAAVGKEQMDANERLFEQYHITTGLPTIILHDADGKPFSTVVGARRTPEEYRAALDEALKVRTERDAKLAAAAGLQGMERARALAAALEVMSENLRDKYPEIVKEIESLDPQNELGYDGFLERGKLYAEQIEAYYKLTETFVGHYSPEDIARQQEQLNAFLAGLEKPQPEVVQQVYSTLADGYGLTRNYEKMHEYHIKALEAAPNSKSAKRLRGNIEYYDKTLLPMLKEQQGK